MNRKILFSLAILVAIVVAAWIAWRKGVFQGRSARPAVRSARAHEARKLPISSEELIAKALAAKEIDYETSLLYRAFALFGDPRLPQKFVTEVIDLDAGTALSSEIFVHEDQLSPAARSALAPFLARPNDPKSTLYFPRSMSTGISLFPDVSAAGVWTNLPAAGGLVKLWTNTDFQLAAPLQTYADNVNQVWPELRKLIRPPTPDQAGDPSMDINPDPAIDVYILPLGQINPRWKTCEQNPGKVGCAFDGTAMGYTFSAAPKIARRSSSAYLTIDGSLTGDALVATLAHELFHASQDSYSNRQRWLSESTATWGEFRVMRNLGRSTSEETGYLPEFIPTLPYEPLDQLEESPGTHQYGAYLYFVFAEMERGAGIVQDIWGATTNLDEAKAVDDVFPFKDHFRGFALKNWNQDPVPDRYEKQDPDLSVFRAPIAATIPLWPGQPHSLDEPVTRLTASYYMLVVADPVAKLRLRFGENTQNPYIGVDAIVTTEKKAAEIRHWTGQSEVSFCRDDPDERVETILLIVSNASLEEDLSSKIDLEPESKPCVEKAATLTMNATYTADAKFQDNKSACQDHITLTYSGSAHYQLLPFQASKNHVNADLLTTRPGPGVQSERSGNFNVDVQGGGSCGNVVWKYFTKTNMVAPDRFPTIAVRLRAGQYGLDQPNISTYIDVDGQMNIPGQAPIPVAGYNVAMAALATLEVHSSQKVAEALQGSFPPFIKRFSNSNRVSDSMDINDPGQGTASLNINYSLTVGRH